MTYIIKTHASTRVHHQHRQEAQNSGSASAWWFWPLNWVVIDSHLTLIPLFPSERIHPFTTRISLQLRSVSQPRMKLVFQKLLSITESVLELRVASLVLKPISASHLYPKHTFNTFFPSKCGETDVDHVKWTILPLVTHSREAPYYCLEESKHSIEIICVSWCTVYKCDTTTFTYVQSEYI